MSKKLFLFIFLLSAFLVGFGFGWSSSLQHYINEKEGYVPKSIIDSKNAIIERQDSIIDVLSNTKITRITIIEKDTIK